MSQSNHFKCVAVNSLQVSGSLL